MRITIVSPRPNLSGGLRVVAEYAKRLRERGHRVAVVIPGAERETLLAAVKRMVLQPHRRRGRRNSLGHYEGITDLLVEAPGAPPFRDDEVPDADVLVACWWPILARTRELSPAKGTRVFFMQGFIDYPMDGLDERRTVVEAGYTIAVAPWLAGVLKPEVADDDLAVVPNSVDTNHFCAPVRSKQRVPTVGMMYESAEFKGCDISAKAVEIARRTIPKLRCVAFGNRKPRKAGYLPGRTRYFMNPPQPEIPGIYASCDAWLFGSRNEGFGLPILEAMACRTPVIGTPAGAAPELLKSGGILVPHDDPERMAQAIVEVCRMDQAAWKKLSDDALKTATSYTWDDATDLFEQALHRAVERSAVRAPQR